MTSLKELEGPSPLQNFITDVIRTINPIKEYLKTSSVGGVTTPDINSTINNVNNALGITGRTPSVSIDVFLTSSATSQLKSDDAWNSIAQNVSLQVNSIQAKAGKTGNEMANQFGLTPQEYSIAQNYNMTDFNAFVRRKYPDGTTPGTTTPGTTTPGTTTPGTTTPGATKVLYPGDTPMPVEYKEPDGTPDSMEPNTSLTPDQKAQHAKYFTKAAQENVKTPDGGKRWREFFKNNYKTIIGISAIVAVVIAVTIKALDSYLASEEAKVNFNSTKTVTGAAGGLFDAFITPTDVEIKWSVKKVGPGGLVSPKSSVRFIMGDAMHFNDSKLSEIEKQQPEEGVNPTKVPNTKNTFQVNTLTGDSTDIDYKNQGWGKIKTDYTRHFGSAANEATTEFASTFSKILSDLFEGLFGNIGTVLIIIFVVIAAFVVGGTVLQQLSKSST